MKNPDNLQKMAKKKLHQLQGLYRDSRFIRTVGKLVAARLLTHTHISPWSGPLTLEDALWAGELEPRITELIPAILLKKSHLFRPTVSLPSDLAFVIDEIRKGRTPPPFRGVDPKLYIRWIGRVGHQGKEPSLLKTFRFNQNDIRILSALKKKTGQNEITIIREGLKVLQEKLDIRTNPLYEPSCTDD